MSKTADRLLEGIKRRVIAPASQPLLDDDDFLALADDVIEQLIVPLLLSVRQDYLATSETQTITNGTGTYDIPYRAIGRALRDLKISDGSTTRDLVLVPSEDAHLYESSTTVSGFYLKGDKIVLVSTPAADGLSLETWYNLAPSRLVTTDQAAVVTGSTATTVTVSSLPSVITTGTVIDFVQAKSGNSILAMDKTVTDATGVTLTFATGDIPSDLVVGDYVSVYQTTPVIPIPNEAYPLLETATAKRCLHALGDFEAASPLENDETQEMTRLRMLLEPRVQGENTIVMNRASLLRGRGRYRRGFSF